MSVHRAGILDRFADRALDPVPMRAQAPRFTTLLDAGQDLLLGSRCLGCECPGRQLCPDCREAVRQRHDEVFVATPSPPPPGLVTAHAAAEYAGVVRRLVLAHKEEQAFALVKPLGELLAAAVSAVVADWSAQVHPLLVPVPTHPASVRARGHDPLLRITRTATRLLADTPAAPRLVPLLRQRGRPHDQSGLDRAERAANLADAFAVRRRGLARLGRSGATVAAIVCDDVITTGATAREAQRALTESGVPVAGIAVVAATRLRRRRQRIVCSLPL